MTQIDELIESKYKTEYVQITNSEDALERLKSGNSRFMNDRSELINITSERRNQLKDSQNPYAVIVSCSDSRTSPSTVFNVGLGELFEIRIAGNVVDSNALGSIEYCVDALHSCLIVVMGHEKCGAITAAYNKLRHGENVKGHMNSIVDKIEPYIMDAESLDDAIHKNIQAVVNQIKKSEIIANLINKDKLKIVKAYYSFDGAVTFE